MLRATATCPACEASCEFVKSHISSCHVCGHRWLTGGEIDRTRLEQNLYTSDYAGYRPDTTFIDAATRFARTELLARVAPPARVLDVGCGAGEFMAVAQSLGYDVEGIDISEAGAAICRQQGLNARAANFLTEKFDRDFDLITMWDVVEHLTDPAAFLTRARSLLSKRGWLFAKIPGFGDFSVGVSNAWPGAAGALLGAPDHVQYFDRQSLSALLARSGLETEWIDAGSARSRPIGGSLKRRLARKLARAVKQISGDSNFYVVARPVS